MAGEYFFSVGTVGRSKCGGRKPSTLLGAARHNRRSIPPGHDLQANIIKDRSHLNLTLEGPDTAEGVQDLAHMLMSGAGIDAKSLRRDFTQAVEFVFSLPIDVDMDVIGYFRDCLAWVKRTLPNQPVLSADIHLDEAAPHCHVLLLPLVDGEMKGSSLVSKRRTDELTKSFFSGVAARHGLRRPATVAKGTKAAYAGAIVEALKAAHDPILNSRAWEVCKRAIRANPGPFGEALGVPPPSPVESTRRSFTQIMTSKGKGPQRERDEKPNPRVREKQTLGFGTRKKHQTLSCVGFDEFIDVADDVDDAYQPPENPNPDPSAFASFMARQATVRHPIDANNQKVQV